MIAGIPDYRPPIEQGVRCVCLRYYVVFTGGGVIEAAATRVRSPHLSQAAAELRARDRALDMHALFVDAREVPFMFCECGHLLDFSPEHSEGGAETAVQ